jgi:hypothetical protein
MTHSHDIECTVNPETLCCDICGADHSCECPHCHGRGYHVPVCPLDETPFAEYACQDGRTIEQACKAEDSFQIAVPGWTSSFWAPGTVGIYEAIRALKHSCPSVHGKMKISRVLSGSQIGCMRIQEVGTINL